MSRITKYICKDDIFLMNLLIDGIKDRLAEAMHELYGFPQHGKHN